MSTNFHKITGERARPSFSKRNRHRMDYPLDSEKSSTKFQGKRGSADSANAWCRRRFRMDDSGSMMPEEQKALVTSSTSWVSH